MHACTNCGKEISAERNARIMELRGKPAMLCAACGKAKVERFNRNRDKRALNAMLRDMCGTSAASARRDMGL
jgi:predicted RNA-binding Zn-ribbon protein involved in translation (DUF1610 family)